MGSPVSTVVEAESLGLAATPPKPRILLVDDMSTNLETKGYDAASYTEELEARGCEVVRCHIKNPTLGAPSLDDSTLVQLSDVEAVCQYALNPAHGIDAVLTDLHMPDYDSPTGGFIQYGKQIVETLQGRFNGPILVHSSQMDEATPHELRTAGAAGVFEKPGQWDEPSEVDQHWKTIAQCLKEGIAEARSAARKL